MLSSLSKRGNRRKLDKIEIRDELKSAKKICMKENKIKSHYSNNVRKILSSNQLPNYDNYAFNLEEDDDCMFADINITDENENGNENDVQSTQRFLEDLQSNLLENKIYQNNSVSANFSLNFNAEFTKCILGSQYDTSDNIRNQSLHILNGEHDNVQQELQLSNINWETQAFQDEIPLNMIPVKGNFYGLPDTVKNLIFEHKRIKSLYEWQNECLNLPAVHKRKNLLYALPTSGGKTLVAEILMLREIICRQKNVLFILPYVSIVQEKVSTMAPFALSLNFLIEEYTAGKGRCPPTKYRKRNSIFIASIEKGAVLFDSLIEAQRANEIGLIVVDELHLIGEKGRGATLESFLTKVMCLKAGIQIVGMSATIGNLPELSMFLNADVYTRGFRPVELKEYIKCGKDLLEIIPNVDTIESKFVHSREVNFKYSSSIVKSDPDHLAGLVSEVTPNESCLIFCSTKKNCENVAILLSKILPKSKYYDHRNKDKLSLMDALDKVCGTLSPVLKQTIPYGIAYHHSGLTADERRMLESAFRFGTICVICCTSTLAAGVNLPAKRVIIRAPYVGAQFMNLCQYKQMVGRAGRAGMGDTGESILICSLRDNYQVGQMLCSPMDKVLSSLDYQDGAGLQTLILSLIGLRMAECRKDLLDIIKQTLLSVQCEDNGVKIETLVTQILRQMFKHKVLKVKEKSANVSEFLVTQDINNVNTQQNSKVILCRSTKFELTNIGRASFKAGIDYKRTNSVYKELKNSLRSLVLTNYAHLLYLVVSFNSNGMGDDLFPVDHSILFQEYTQLDEDTLCFIQVLGITEANIARIVKTMSTKGPVEQQLNRLFKVFIIRDILKLTPLHLVAEKYNIDRGIVQSLITQSVSGSNAIVRLCEEVDEFWCYKPLFERITSKLDRCGTLELEPLLELPSVKINRAKQLYAAGFHTIEDIAKVKPIDLSKSVEHMPIRTAKEIISAAKLILLRKLETLQEETDIIMSCLQSNEDVETI